MGSDSPGQRHAYPAGSNLISRSPIRAHSAGSCTTARQTSCSQCTAIDSVTRSERRFLRAGRASACGLIGPVTDRPSAVLPQSWRRGITDTTSPGRPGTLWERNRVHPVAEHRAWTPGTHSPHQPREVRRQGRSRKPLPARLPTISGEALVAGQPTQDGVPNSGRRLSVRILVDPAPDPIAGRGFHAVVGGGSTGTSTVLAAAMDMPSRAPVSSAPQTQRIHSTSPSGSPSANLRNAEA